MPKSIEYAHRKYEKANTHKKKQIHIKNKTELQNTRIHSSLLDK